MSIERIAFKPIQQQFLSPNSNNDFYSFNTAQFFPGGNYDWVKVALVIGNWERVGVVFFMTA